MSQPFFTIWNTHTVSCGEPPIVTNQSSEKYYGYFQNRFTEQWAFIYDPEQKAGELRGGDIGWDTIVIVKDGRTELDLGKAETAWLKACWQAATGVA